MQKIRFRPSGAYELAKAVEEFGAGVGGLIKSRTNGCYRKWQSIHILEVAAHPVILEASLRLVYLL